jgi:hypothetical protein
MTKRTRVAVTCSPQATAGGCFKPGKASGSDRYLPLQPLRPLRPLRPLHANPVVPGGARFARFAQFARFARGCPVVPRRARWCPVVPSEIADHWGANWEPLPLLALCRGNELLPRRGRSEHDASFLRRPFVRAWDHLPQRLLRRPPHAADDAKGVLDGRGGPQAQTAQRLSLRAGSARLRPQQLAACDTEPAVRRRAAARRGARQRRRRSGRLVDAVRQLRRRARRRDGRANARAAQCARRRARERKVLRLHGGHRRSSPVRVRARRAMRHVMCACNNARASGFACVLADATGTSPLSSSTSRTRAAMCPTTCSSSTPSSMPASAVRTARSTARSTAHPILHPSRHNEELFV